MFRRYTITIEVTDSAAASLGDLEKVLGCSISEPSNWVEYGSTTKRGLTFLDRDGNELNSVVFVHQPLFNAEQNKRVNEINEIKAFVFDALVAHYAIAPADVKIKVAEHNRI